jgi:hypothetical protein
VTWIVAQHGSRTQNIVPERAKWRDKIRQAATAAARDEPDAWRDLWITLKLNTNPYDPEDVATLDLAKNGIDEIVDPDRKEEMLDRIALLLKHDWQRAKREVGENGGSVRRVPYAEFQLARSLGQLHRLGRYWTGQRPSP